MNRTATAPPATICQREGLVFRAARVAHLAGGEKAIDHRQMFAVPDRLVFQLPSELSEGGIGHRFCQLGSRQPTNAQVLNRDAFVFLHQTGREFMQKIRPLMDYAAVDQRHLALGPQPAPALLSAAAQPALGTTQCSLGLAEESRHRNPLSIRHHREVVQPEVHADDRGRTGSRQRRSLVE